MQARPRRRRPVLVGEQLSDHRHIVDDVDGLGASACLTSVEAGGLQSEQLVTELPFPINLDRAQLKDKSAFEQVRRTWTTLGFRHATGQLWIMDPANGTHHNAVTQIENPWSIAYCANHTTQTTDNRSQLHGGHANKQHRAPHVLEAIGRAGCPTRPSRRTTSRKAWPRSPGSARRSSGTYEPPREPGTHRCRAPPWSRAGRRRFRGGCTGRRQLGQAAAAEPEDGLGGGAHDGVGVVAGGVVGDRATVRGDARAADLQAGDEGPQARPATRTR